MQELWTGEDDYDGSESERLDVEFDRWRRVHGTVFARYYGLEVRARACVRACVCCVRVRCLAARWP